MFAPARMLRRHLRKKAWSKHRRKDPQILIPEKVVELDVFWVVSLDWPAMNKQ